MALAHHDMLPVSLQLSHLSSNKDATRRGTQGRKTDRLVYTIGIPIMLKNY